MPYQIGYQLGEQYVVAAALVADESVGPIAAIQWGTTHTSNRDRADDVARDPGPHRSRQSHHDQLLLVGYGPTA